MSVKGGRGSTPVRKLKSVKVGVFCFNVYWTQNTLKREINYKKITLTPMSYSVVNNQHIFRRRLRTGGNYPLLCGHLHKNH